jgi:hypothetical protein
MDIDIVLERDSGHRERCDDGHTCLIITSEPILDVYSAFRLALYEADR